MTSTLRSLTLGLSASLVLLCGVAQAPAAAQERFEIASIKSIRPTLVNTIGALQQRDAARAKDAFAAYDSGWNGVEVYFSVRSKETYETLELNYQPKINKALSAATPDFTAALADAQAMLAKFDESVASFAKLPPLNALYDDVTRLRIVRAHLRETAPALKAGDMAKAEKSFDAFGSNWDSIEELIKERSAEAYVAIEKGMIEVEQAFDTSKPDVAKLTTLVNDIMGQYNAVLAEVVKEARAK